MESSLLSPCLSRNFPRARANRAQSLAAPYISRAIQPSASEQPSRLTTTKPTPPALTKSFQAPKKTIMFTPHFLLCLLSTFLLVLITPICAKSTSTSIASLGKLAADYERAALKGFSADSTKKSVNELEGLLATYIKMDRMPQSQVRMLLSVEQQVAMYRFLGKELGEDKVKELREEPDVCERISTFVGFVFDNAADLLRHGAGLEKNCMRGFQQVLHVREVIRLVLEKMEMPSDVGNYEQVCIDKVLIAVYGWLKGALVGMARHEGLFRVTVPRETEDMKESLKEKRRELLKVRINKMLDLEEVKPEPGEDFPEIKGIDGCIEEEGDVSGDSSSDDDDTVNDNPDSSDTTNDDTLSDDSENGDTVNDDGVKDSAGGDAIGDGEVNKNSDNSNTDEDDTEEDDDTGDDDDSN